MTKQLKQRKQLKQSRGVMPFAALLLCGLMGLVLGLALMLGATGRAEAQAPATGTTVTRDTFTDATAGVLLDAHTGETGATWTKNTGQPATIALSGGYAQATTGAGGASGVYFASGAPATTEYDVSAPLVVLTTGATTGAAYVISHASGTTAITGYLGGFGGGGTPQVEMYKFSAGSGAALGTAVPLTRTAGEVYTTNVLTRLAGSSLSVYLSVSRASDGFYLTTSGTWQASFTACVSATDASPLPTGTAGLWLGGNMLKADSLIATNVGSPSLSAGTLAAVNAPGGIQLSLSAPVSGGSGAGYGYKIYRDTQPAVATAGTPYAAVSGSAFAYTDTAVVPGTVYYYKATAYDGAANVVNLVPSGLGSVSTAAPLAVAGTTGSGQYVLVFIGDSITANSSFVPNSGTILSPTYEYYCIQGLSALSGVRFVTGSNQGHSGFTSNDWLPSVNTSSCFTAAETAATALKASYPSATLVFIIRLGTNDSATAGSNNNPAGQASPATVQANLTTLGSRLLADYSGSRVFLDHPTYYTPNVHNGYTYEQAGLTGLVSYFPAIDAAVSSLKASYPGRVFIGETTAFADFAGNYQSFLVAESGANGTFYLHPNGTGGTAELGRLEAAALYNALLGSLPIVSISRQPSRGR